MATLWSRFSLPPDQCTDVSNVDGKKKEIVSVFFCSLLLLVKFQNKSSKNCLVYMQKQEKMELSRCSRSVILKSSFAAPNVHRDKGTVKVRVLSSQTAFVFLLAIRWSL